MDNTAENTPKIIRVTLVKSPIGYTVRHKATIRALGLRKMHQTVQHVDSPTLRGMLYKVSHLVEVEEVIA
ncbi:MAG: 50S ribosomal protein L30 [Anaerolineales bacterium]|jgi:large subunit ribosomal protein L30|nr:50S ribosomal protein L30 [Anaerolineales bacterium]